MDTAAISSRRISMNDQGNSTEHTFKILVIGDIGTGKTSIIKRYVHNYYPQNYRSTIGVDFALKVLSWDADTILRMQLWDIAGQERFGNMTRVYYKEAAGALVVFDLARHATLDGAIKWKTDLDQKLRLLDGRPIPAILVGNKCDLSELQIPEEQLNRLCADQGFIGWYKTSAKENVGIDDAIAYLASNILYVKQAGHYEIPVFPKEDQPRTLSTSDHRNKTKRKCC